MPRGGMSKLNPMKWDPVLFFFVWFVVLVALWPWLTS